MLVKLVWPAWSNWFCWPTSIRGGQLQSSGAWLMSHLFSIPIEHSWLIKIHSKLKITIRWLLESCVLAGAGEKLWHQSGPRGLELPTPAGYAGRLTWSSWSSWSDQHGLASYAGRPAFAVFSLVTSPCCVFTGEQPLLCFGNKYKLKQNQHQVKACKVISIKI